MTTRVLYLGPDPTDRRETVASLAQVLPESVIDGVSSTDDALSRAETESVDCLVTDHADPEIDAVAVLERLRPQFPSLPVVVFPREGSEALASDVLGAGATDYVRRAEGFELLAERLERRCDGLGQRPNEECCEILDAIDDAVILYDPADGAVVDINEQACELVGCRPEDACACSLATLRADEGDESVEDVFDRALESGRAHVEWNCETTDGEQFWAEITFTRVDRGDGVLVIAMITDISERKRRMQRLRSFRKAVERAGHSIYMTEPDGTIQYVNPAFEEVTGYSAAEAIGSTPRLLKSGVHDRAFYQNLWRTILAGDVWEDQIVNRRKNGETYTVNQTIAPITDESGEITNFVAVNADITAQKRREAQLRQLHAAVREWLEATSRTAVATRTTTQLEELLDLECNAVYLYDDSSGQLRPAAVSESADETFESHPQFSEDEGIAWRVFETGREERHDDVREAPDVYNPKTPIRSEIALPLGDHGVLLVADREVEAFGETDLTLLRIVASSLEATFDRIARERELEAQKERFEQFAQVVSHDLRNPLTVAMGELERARETHDETAFDAVVQSHERIATIIDDLLWLAREGKSIADPEPVSLAQVAQNAWDNVEAPTVSFEQTCDRYVMADPGRLQQLFENLFRNSVEHGSTSPDSQPRRNSVEHGSTSSRPQADDSVEHGPTSPVPQAQQDTVEHPSDAETVAVTEPADSELTIRVGLTDDGFYVADTGSGIPEDERDRILETGYTTAEDGTGLGLSIVQTVVDSHGWDLDITKSEEGGARFEIRSGFVN